MVLVKHVRRIAPCVPIALALAADVAAHAAWQHALATYGAEPITPDADTLEAFHYAYGAAHDAVTQCVTAHPSMQHRDAREEGQVLALADWIADTIQHHAVRAVSASEQWATACRMAWPD